MHEASSFDIAQSVVAVFLYETKTESIDESMWRERHSCTASKALSSMTYVNNTLSSVPKLDVYDAVSFDPTRFTLFFFLWLHFDLITWWLWLGHEAVQSSLQFLLHQMGNDSSMA